jgi:3-oxoacyl-[acyl-carrier protein] reductase
VVTPVAERLASDPARLQQVLQTVPLRKIARPHDVATAIVYLASSHLAGHVSGQILTVSGGMEGRVLYQPSEIDPHRA